MITEQENRIRNKFFEEKGIKAYEGHINDGGNIVWKEEYVKWLESKLSQHAVIKNEVAVCPVCDGRGIGHFSGEAFTEECDSCEGTGKTVL